MKKDVEKGLNSNLEFPKLVTESLTTQINQADNKALGTITVLGILAGVLTTQLDKLKDTLNANYVWMIIVAISALMLLLSFKAAIRVIYPRMSKGNKDGMYYFEDVLQHNKEEYINRGAYLTTEGVARQLYRSSYEMSKIADSKFKSLKIAIKLTVIVLIWTIAVVILV